MTLTTDKFGRIVIPKECRDVLGADPGVPLEWKMEGSRFIVERKQEKPLLVRKGGVLVYTGRIDKNTDIRKLIEKDREERARHVSGLRR